MDSETQPADGIMEIGGNHYMTDPQGHLVPLDLVKPQDALEDQTVRKIIQYADDLSSQIARFASAEAFLYAAAVMILVRRLGRAL